jgi:hypothetical protein
MFLSALAMAGAVVLARWAVGVEHWPALRAVGQVVVSIVVAAFAYAAAASLLRVGELGELARFRRKDASRSVALVE